MKKQTSNLYASFPRAMDSLIQMNKSLMTHLSAYDNKEANEKTKLIYGEQTDALIKLLALRCTAVDSPDYLELNNDFTYLFVHTDFFEDKIRLEQLPDRFHAQTGDSFSIRILKTAKHIQLYLFWLSIRLGNIFRKNKRSLRYPWHYLREKNLAVYTFIYKFHLDFLPLFQQFLHDRFQLLKAQNNCDNIYESFMLDNAGPASRYETEFVHCQNSLHVTEENLRQEVDQIERKLKKDFHSYRGIAGTIEFPGFRYKAGRINRRLKRLFKRYQKTMQKYHIADQAVTEYWLFEAGIRAAILDIDKVVKNGAGEMYRRGHSKLLPDIKLINTTLGKTRVLLKKFEPTDLNIQELTKLVESAKSIAKGIIDRAAQGELMQHYESVYPAMLESLAQVPEKSLFSSKVFKTQRIQKTHKLKKVNGRRILKDILDGTIQDVIISEGKRLAQNILNLNSDIEELLQLIEYSFEYYGPKTGSFPNEDRKELDEGLKRAIKKSEDFKTELSTLIESTNNLFQELNAKFRSEIRASLEPASLISTERSTRLSGIWRQSRRKSSDSITVLNTGTKDTFQWLAETYKNTKNKYFNLRNLLGISEVKEVLSSEISDYLADTDKSISQLPLMYQRLFTNRALEDERFFVKRDIAENHLDKVFSNWKDGKFAPACIVAEKGGGATTFLNFFEKSIKQDFEIRRIDLNSRILTEEDFSTLLHKIFPENSFSTIEELLIQLKNRDTRIIVILENIQYLFMKRTGGFSNLSRFFNIISQSNSTVFWLCSCLEYSWRYLDNSFEINDYFAYVIPLHKLSKETLTEAILKRHRPSGFEMVFRSYSEHKKPKLFLRKKNTDTQEVIRDEFFDSIRNATHGNLSFAFLLWLRSVDRVEDNIIYFKYRKLNLGFLRSLSVQKLTSLYSILIHSGLTPSEHAEIFNLSENESFIQLMVMTDDGILIQRHSRYKINPLLYRQVVNHLESTNFIH